MHSKRVVITGEGIISAIGNDKPTVLRSLFDGKSGIGPIRYLHSVHTELPVGEVKLSNDEMKALLNIPAHKEVSRTVLMGILAIQQALNDSNPNSQHPTPITQTCKTVLISGTTVGGMDITEQHYSSLKQSDEHLDCLNQHDCGSSTRLMADHFSIFSDYTTISTACSAAANAIIVGAEMIKAGEADIVVAGGSEALTRFHLNGFNSLMILDKEPCRPFDATRAGLNLGEGAAFVVLESEEHALGRKAPIHAVLAGYGNACDAFHQTATSANGEGPFLAMTEALRSANMQPTDISYVNAHGTATPNNDQSESIALQRVFGQQLPPISSTKAFTGHATSASGSIEAVICLLALQHQFIPGNLGWQQSMPDGIIPTKGEDHVTLNTVLCNSFGFGGNDSSLIFTAYHPTTSNPQCSKSNAQSSKFKVLSSKFKVLSRVEITSEDQLGEIRQFVSPMEARRMGKLLKSSLLASLKALHQAGIDSPDAIITATSMGCLENSERLLEQLEIEGESMLKPTYFMQSTHNTLSSNIAIRTHCHGYNITYTQGKQSMEWALRDANRLLRSGKYNNVLVSCHDETTPLYSSLMERMGCQYDFTIHSVAMVIGRR